MNLWGHDLLQKWKSHIIISPIIETILQLKYASEKNNKIYYQEQSLTIQIIPKQGTTAGGFSKTSTALLLKQLTNNPE